MSKSLFSIEQRLNFIHDCYASGLSIYAWCKENEIAPGTFYSWIHHLKKQGYRLPDTVPQKVNTKSEEESHEIVKVDIMEENDLLKSNNKSLYRKPENISCSSPSAIRIQVADVTLDISESVNPVFLSRILQAVRYNL